MTTVRKNSQEYKRALKNAVNIRCYSLDNDFLGKLVSSIDDHSLEDGKLVKGLDRYTLRVHSNLWYEWTAA